MLYTKSTWFNNGYPCGGLRIMHKSCEGKIMELGNEKEDPCMII
jgi:hypothetical protein